MKKDMYLQILRLIKEGLTAPEIYRTLKLSPQNFNYYIRILEANGLIITKPTYPRTYALTKAGEEALERGLNLKVSPRVSDRHRQHGVSSEAQISVHDVKVKIPILKKGEPIPPEKEIEVKGWVKKYYRLEIPFPVTIEETTRNIIFHFHEMKYPRKVDIIGSIVTDVMRYTYLIASWLHTKYGWVLDVPNARVITQHIAIEVPEAKEHLRPGTRVRFSKKARAIDGKELNQDSTAWVDNTPSERNVETGDMDFTEAFLKMPFTVQQMYREQTEFFRLHNELIENVNRVMRLLELKLKEGEIK